MDKVYKFGEHGKYALLLQKHGYDVKYHWVSDQEFESVSVYHNRFHNFVGEFSTPRKAYNSLVCKH